MELGSMEHRSKCGTEFLNDGTQFVGTQKYFGTRVLKDGTRFDGTQK